MRFSKVVFVWTMLTYAAWGSSPYGVQSGGWSFLADCTPPRFIERTCEMSSDRVRPVLDKILAWYFSRLANEELFSPSELSDARYVCRWYDDGCKGLPLRSDGEWAVSSSGIRELAIELDRLRKEVSAVEEKVVVADTEVDAVVVSETEVEKVVVSEPQGDTATTESKPDRKGRGNPKKIKSAISDLELEDLKRIRADYEASKRANGNKAEFLGAHGISEKKLRYALNNTTPSKLSRRAEKENRRDAP